MQKQTRFYGWSVAWAAFTVAVFAWGIGFYGPSVFLQTLYKTNGWSISTISTAITAHFLLSAGIIVYLPEIHRRFGIAQTTLAGAAFAAVGLIGWSNAWHPWQLFLAAIPSAIGWAVMSGAALNAMIARWFDRERPKAMSLAFNGASVGGVIFVPLWVFLIGMLGFPVSAGLVGTTMVFVVGALSIRLLRYSPGDLGLNPDGARQPQPKAKLQPSLSRLEIMRDTRFITISVAFALGLFAQIGLLSHLIVRLSPDIGTNAAGAFVSLATVCAVVGRTLLGWLIGERDRRVAAAVNFAVQILGVALLIVGSATLTLALGCIFFGLGIGNLTSLPPLIAQKEFSRGDVAAVVALVIAINQAVFAFAPAIFGVIRDATTDYAIPFLVAAVVQAIAAAIIMIGRARSSASEIPNQTD